VDAYNKYERKIWEQYRRSVKYWNELEFVKFIHKKHTITLAPTIEYNCYQKSYHDEMIPI
jgi:hypothetical protein